MITHRLPLLLFKLDVYQEGLESVLKFLRGYIPEAAGIGSSKLAAQLETIFNKPDYADVTFRADGKEDIYLYRYILDSSPPLPLIIPWRCIFSSLISSLLSLISYLSSLLSLISYLSSLLSLVSS